MCSSDQMFDFRLKRNFTFYYLHTLTNWIWCPLTPSGLKRCSDRPWPRPLCGWSSFLWPTSPATRRAWSASSSMPMDVTRLPLPGPRAPLMPSAGRMTPRRRGPAPGRRPGSLRPDPGLQSPIPNCCHPAQRLQSEGHPPRRCPEAPCSPGARQQWLQYPLWPAGREGRRSGLTWGKVRATWGNFVSGCEEASLVVKTKRDQTKML